MLITKDYKHFQIGDTEFEGAAAAGKALPGDSVILENGVVRLLERAAHKHIVGTLELASKVRYGMTARNHPIYLFTPFAESYPPFFVGCSQKDVSQNVLALVEFSHWDDGTCPRGNLLQVLGPAGDIEAEQRALAEHASPYKNKKLGALAEPEPITERQRGITFHVDPPGCRDIDDAITLNPLPGYNIEVCIHIADVSSWLLANPQLGEKASQISQTLYRDGVAIRPMFPAELSEDKFSLLPGQDRRAWTLKFIWNTVLKDATSLSWGLEMIRISQSFTYHTVTKSMFANDLEEICSGLAGRQISDSHEWIEQLMLFYNREAAKLLRTHGTGVLRRHSGPDAARFAAYEAAGLPAARLAMAAGEYCGADEPDAAHWGLGQDIYCHASSPIRRWADCLNQLAIRRIIFKEELAIPMPEAIQHMNLRSKALKAYERDMTFMRAVLNSGSEVLGTVAEPGRVWVPSWGRIVKAEAPAAPGTAVKIKFFCDATQRNWKRRMVLKIELAGDNKGLQK